jgi:hypothetical protein
MDYFFLAYAGSRLPAGIWVSGAFSTTFMELQNLALASFALWLSCV